MNATSTSEREPTTDERMGMAWWNGLSTWERSSWLRVAAEQTGQAIPSPAEAWASWKARPWHSKSSCPDLDAARKKTGA